MSAFDLVIAGCLLGLAVVITLFWWVLRSTRNLD